MSGESCLVTKTKQITHGSRECNGAKYRDASQHGSFKLKHTTSTDDPLEQVLAGLRTSIILTPDGYGSSITNRTYPERQ